MLDVGQWNRPNHVTGVMLLPCFRLPGATYAKNQPELAAR